MRGRKNKTAEVRAKIKPRDIWAEQFEYVKRGRDCTRKQFYAESATHLYALHPTKGWRRYSKKNGIPQHFAA